MSAGANQTFDFGHSVERRGRLRRRWDRLFEDSPLVRHEAGLSRPLRSRWLLLMALAVLPALLVVLRQLLQEDPWLPPGIDRTPTRSDVVFGGLSVLVGSARAVLCPLFVALAWARDRDARRREEIAVTALTPRELLAGKTVLWLAPPLLALGLTVLGVLIVNLWWWLQLGELPWSAAMEQVARSGEQSRVGFMVMMALFAFGGPIQVVTFWFLTLGLVTHFSLRTFRPVLSCALTLISLAGIYAVAMLVQMALLMATMSWGRMSPPGAGTFLLALLGHFVIFWLLEVLIALVIWRRLPRRIAETYGMAP
jgi:hypothetical protein